MNILSRNSSFSHQAFVVHNNEKKCSILSSDSSSVTDKGIISEITEDKSNCLCRYLWNIQFVNVVLWTLNIIVTGTIIILIGYYFSIQELLRSIDTNRKTILKLTINKAEVISNSFSNSLIGISSSIQMYQRLNGLMDINMDMNKDDLVRLLYYSIDEKESIYHSVRAVYIGYSNGYMLGVDRRAMRAASTRIIDNVVTLDFYTLNEESFLLDTLLFNIGHFDSRERDWYSVGKNIQREGGCELSNPFMSVEMNPFLSVTAVLPIWNLNDTFEGVLGVHIYLSDLVDIVLHSKAREDTELIVLTTNKGILISNSLVNETNKEIIMMNESSNLMIRKIGEAALLKYESYDYLINSNPNDVVTIDFTFEGTEYICDMTAFNKNGLKLNIFYVFLKSNIFQVVSTYAIYSFIVSSSFIFCTIVISLLLSCSITRPIRKISKDIGKISNLDLSFHSKRSVLDFREISSMNEALMKLKKEFTNFQKFLPIEVIKYLTNAHKKIKNELWERNISVMFIDIKDFTSRTEFMCSEDLIILLRQFFTISERWIVKNNGIVDKFIGDCVMAFFGCPTVNEQHELAAVATSFDILKDLEKRNKKNKKNKVSIKVKIGINSGKCLLGFIGSPYRLSFTCLGDNVNIAARLVSTFNETGSKIYIAENTHYHVKDHIEYVSKGLIRLKGKRNSINIYEAIKPKEFTVNLTYLD